MVKGKRGRGASFGMGLKKAITPQAQLSRGRCLTSSGEHDRRLSIQIDDWQGDRNRRQPAGGLWLRDMDLRISRRPAFDDRFRKPATRLGSDIPSSFAIFQAKFVEQPFGH